jgi:RNA polymerase sigma factor (sigma-70 family)
MKEIVFWLRSMEYERGWQAGMNLDDSISTRATLLERLRRWDDHSSWEEFFDIYWRLIHRVALKAGLTDQEAQEVVQETVITVSRNMSGFRYDPAECTFKTWLLNVTRWRIVDQIRKRARAQQRTWPSVTENETFDQIPDPDGCELESIWDREWETHLLEAAIERVKQRVAPKQYQMFYLHVLKELPVGEVARRVGSNVGAVYLAKHRVGRMLRSEIKALQTGGGNSLG